MVDTIALILLAGDYPDLMLLMLRYSLQQFQLQFLGQLLLQPGPEQVIWQLQRQHCALQFRPTGLHLLLLPLSTWLFLFNLRAGEFLFGCLDFSRFVFHPCFKFNFCICFAESSFFSTVQKVFFH